MNHEDFEPTYLVALDEIYHAHWAARRRKRINLVHKAYEQLWPQGHPTAMMQITGTNGKGSVSHYLAQGLQAYGRTGTWTGPHVFDYAERIHIDGQKATHRDIARVFRNRIQPLQDEFSWKYTSLTFAELGILLALCLFEEHQVDWAIMEVGNGGRYTPLMALPMKACLLTNVGSDHPKSLGYALWQRALEKAGIARPGVPFFTSAQGEALTYVVKAAEAEGAPVFRVGEEERETLVPYIKENSPGFVATNLALAVAVVRHFYRDAKPAELVARMQERLPARFWQKEPQVIVDVAHNPDKIRHLVEELTLHYPNVAFRFLLGLSRSRDPLKVFSPLFPIAREIVVTSTGHAGQDPADIAATLKEEFPAARTIADPVTAYEQIKSTLKDDELMVVTGSAYMIDQALNPNQFIKETNATYGRRYKQDGPPMGSNSTF